MCSAQISCRWRRIKFDIGCVSCSVQTCVPFGSATISRVLWTLFRTVRLTNYQGVLCTRAPKHKKKKTSVPRVCLPPPTTLLSPTPPSPSPFCFPSVSHSTSPSFSKTRALQAGKEQTKVVVFQFRGVPRSSLLPNNVQNHNRESFVFFFIILTTIILSTLYKHMLSPKNSKRRKWPRKTQYCTTVRREHKKSETTAPTYPANVSSPGDKTLSTTVLRSLCSCSAPQRHKTTFSNPHRFPPMKRYNAFHKSNNFWPRIGFFHYSQSTLPLHIRCFFVDVSPSASKPSSGPPLDDPHSHPA